MLSKYKNITLDEWQNINKPLNEIIVQPSNPKGDDKSEGYDFSIGMHYNYSRLSDKDKTNIQIGNHSNLLLCAVCPYTDRSRRGDKMINRQILIEQFKEKYLNNVQLAPYEYYKKLSNYKFIISPEGNGIDCHRHYESLLAGCIPIIENNKDMKRKYRNLPILYTNNYLEITPNYLIKKYEEFKNNKYDFSNLFLSNHNETSQKLIKEYGNYWCLKMNKKLHYIL